MNAHLPSTEFTQPVVVPVNGVQLQGELKMPAESSGVVIFAYGSGSSRHSPRNQFVAQALRDAKLGTLLFDLLTREEEIADQQTGHLRFDIELLAKRLAHMTEWVTGEIPGSLRVGYFGASTGGGAALMAAAVLGDAVSAVVSRGGRPDLAGEALTRVKAPTLLIVGGRDVPVIELNHDAYELLNCEKEMAVVAHASHLFEEPGALEQVGVLAAEWFGKYFR